MSAACSSIGVSSYMTWCVAFGADGFQDVVEGLQQVPDLHILKVHLAPTPVRMNGPAAEPLRLRFGGVAEVARGVLEGLVFQELADKLGTGVELQVAGLALLDRRRRQQHPRLDLHERGRHHQKVPGQVRVHAGKDFHVTHVLLGDPGDGNIVDVHLLPADEVEQQIQRPVIDFQVDAIVAHTPVIVAIPRAKQTKLFAKKRQKKVQRRS